MVRSAVADESLLTYIQNLAKLDVLTIGLILGQTAAEKDLVIHFARTPPVQAATEKIEKNKKASDTNVPIKKIENISEFWIADHAKHATRMLPGGMYVLGIFVISETDLLSPFNGKLRAILNQIHKQLSINSYLFGNQEIQDKLVLNYCTATENFTCKTYNVNTSSVKPGDFKFQPKAMKWNQIECKFDVDQTFPIFKGRYDWSLKKHLQAILDTLNKSFEAAVFLYDHEIKDNDEILESLGKKKKITKSKSSIKDKSESKAIQVSIFLPCDTKDTEDDLEIKGCGGFIRIMGQITSKLWLYPKMTIQEASRSVVEDIVRSLASRLEMHWDSLIDEESGSAQDTNSLHEPPRRVLISLPANKVMLSDYLFPGEGANDAFISLSELLDITLQDKKSIVEVEGQPDLTEIYPSTDQLNIDGEETQHNSSSADSNKFMYVTGFIVALIVLIVSLVIHFLKGE